MYVGTIDEINHLLLAVWCNGVYLSQIEEIVDHYGTDAVLEAELALYETTVFRLILK